MQVYAQIIFVLTAVIVLVFGTFLSRRISSQIDSLASAAERLSRGEFDVEVKVSGDMEPLGEAFNKMAQGLKSYAARLEGEAEERGGSGKESAFLKGIKRNLVPATMPVKDGYEILALYNPSEKNGFDIYDVVEADDKIATGYGWRRGRWCAGCHACCHVASPYSRSVRKIGSFKSNCRH